MSQERTMTDRVLDLVFAHDTNPMETIASLLTVAAMMASRLKMPDTEWRDASNSVWSGVKEKWAEHDQEKS